MTRWIPLPLALAASLLTFTPSLAGPRRHAPREEVSPDASIPMTRQASIDMLEDLLRETDPQGDRRAEMLFRLGELYAQEARRERLLAFGTCDADPDACPEGPDLRAYTRRQDRALSLFRMVVQGYPRYERTGEARFGLALGLLERDRNADARRELQAYVRNEPRGDHAYLAWLQLGELDLDAGDATRAVRSFRQAASFEDSPYRATAEHRLGWALKNEGEDREAVQAIRRAVALATTQGDQTLVEEGRKDLVRFAVELGNLESVEDLLGQGEERIRALTLAARKHAEQGEVDEAVQVWRRVIAEAPEHPERPAALAAITAEYRQQGRWADAVRAARRLEVEHRRDTTWAQANATDLQELAAARDSADKELRRTATAAHLEARKLKRRPGGPEAAAAADGAYAAWLTAFEDRDQAPEVHRAYGELLYEQGAYEAAFAQYEAVWTKAPGTPGARRSAIDGLHAAERLLEANPAPRPAADVELATAPARPLTVHEQRLLSAVDAHLATGQEHAAAVHYRAAYVLYGAFHFEEAATRFRRVIALEPRSNDAERAAHLIADMLAIRESWQALAENASFYAEQDGLGTPKFRASMAALARKAELKQVEAQLAEDGDRARAARSTLAWLERHNERAEPPIKSVAYRDTAAHWEAVGDPAAAAAVRRAFLEDAALAEDAERQDQWLALGDDLERLADWSGAAEAYGRGADLGGEDDRLAEARWRRALLLDALEDPGSEEAYTAFIAAFPEDPRKADARVRRARVVDDAKAWTPLLDDAELPPEVRLTAGLALHRLGEPSALDRAEQVIPDPLPKALVDLAAEVRFLRLTPRFERFAANQLTPAPGASPRAEARHFARQIAALQQEAREIVNDTKRVLATRSGPWGLAAAVRLGQVQEAWAELLDASPTPTHLSETQAALYRQELADIIWIRREEARQAYVAALERAYTLGIYTEATALARERLSTIDPVDWPVQHEELAIEWRIAGERRTSEPESSTD